MTSPNDNVAPQMKTCKKGLHQYASSLESCLECHRAASKKYSDKNRAICNERIREWKQNNREKDSIYHKIYYQEHLGECLEVSKKWKKANPEKCETHRKNHAKRNPEFSVWMSIRKRCSDPSSLGYKYCGAKGISVCDRWLGKDGYAHFVADVGPRPSLKHNILRIEGALGYSPGNCMWGTKKEETRKTIRSRLYTYEGKTLCLTDWAAETGISWSTLYNRVVSAKWSLSEAFNKEPHSVDRSAHEELVRIAVQWLRGTKKCSVVLSEMASMAMERPDAIGWRASVTQSIVVECKANIYDFWGDSKKPFRVHPYMGMGILRYYIVPEGMVKPEDVPENWGLLYAGKRVSVEKEAVRFEKWNRGAEEAMLISALRRTQLRIDQPLHEWLKWDSANSPIRPTMMP